MILSAPWSGRCVQQVLQHAIRRTGRKNRRVAVRRITPLLRCSATDSSSAANVSRLSSRLMIAGN